MTTSELSRFSRLAIEFEAGASGPTSPEGVLPWIFLPSRLLFAVRLLGSIELVIVSALSEKVIELELVHRDLTLLVLGVSRRQKSRWTPRKYQTSTATSARQRELSFGLAQMVISPHSTVSITTSAERSPSSAKNDRFAVLDASSVTYPSCPSMPLPPIPCDRGESPAYMRARGRRGHWERRSTRHCGSGTRGLGSSAGPCASPPRLWQASRIDSRRPSTPPPRRACGHATEQANQMEAQCSASNAFHCLARSSPARGFIGVP